MKTRKRAPWKKGQSGYLHARCGTWYGQFRIATRTGSQKRTVKLGAVDSLSELDAQIKLKAVIDGFEKNSGAMARIGSGSALTIDSNLDEGKTTFLNRGIVSEMVVTVDLLSKGYAVYRAVSPLAGCDLVATLDGLHFFRIEVKSATIANGGRVLAKLKGQIGKFDLLAVVFGDGKIEYRHAAELDNDTYPLEGCVDLLLGTKIGEDFASQVPDATKTGVENNAN